MQKNKYTSILCAFVFLVALGFSNEIKASHIMGGNITYTYLSPGNYAINLSLFRDCNGINLGSTAIVNVSSPTCGSQTVTMNNIGGPLVRTPLCPSETDACDGPGGTYGVEEFIYRGTVSLPVGCGNNWTLSWTSCCRNNVITNLTSAGSTYIWATLDNTISGGNSSPAFNNEPTLYLCTNQENRYNNGMTDVEDDSLVYSLVDCRGSSITNLVTYVAGLSGTSPLLANYMTIDPQTGEVVVFPTATQVGVVCVLVEEYRNGTKISEVIRDLQFTVTDCSFNSLPIASGINGTADSTGTTGSYSTTTCAGEQLCFDIQGFDKQSVPTAPFQNFTMNWNFGINGATFVVDYSLPYPVGQFCWTPTSADVGENFFFIEMQDDACPFLGSNVYTYKVNVLQTVSVDITMPNPDSVPLLDPGDTLQLMASSSSSNVTYAWFPATGLSCTNCPNPVLTAVSANATQNTTYTVTVTDPQGCSSSSSVDVTTFAVSTSNIKELKRINVFPNPVTEQSVVEYELSKANSVQLELFDVLGKRIAVIENENNQASGIHRYNLGNYTANQPKGIYMLRITIGGQAMTKRLLVR